MKEHIFSKNHKKKGILLLGKNEDNIVDKFVNIVKLADHKNLLIEGMNQIYTKIKNHEVTLRIFIKEGVVLKINGFKEITTRRLGNAFELFVTEYCYD